MYRANLNAITVSLLLAIVISGCSSTPEEKSKQSYVAPYFAAIDRLPAIDPQEIPSKATIQARFAKVFDSIGNDAALREAVNEAYASDVYFNDTLHSFTDSGTLYQYLKHVGSQVEAMDVDILDVSLSDQSAYVRWSITVTYHDLNDNQPTVSIGLTHLRFNSQGKIALHQDYWDSTDGFYRHIPIISSMIKFVNKKLHNAFDAQKH